MAILLELARAHGAAFRNREGLRSAREALNIARRLQSPLAVGQSLSIATLCHYQRGDYVAAVATGLDAVEAYSDGDLNGRSRALQSIALALFSVEAFDLAEAMARRSVADARAGGDPEREAYASNVLGVILSDRGQFKEGRRAFRFAARHYRLAGDQIRMKKCTSNIGHTYRKQGNWLERNGRVGLAGVEWERAVAVYRIALGAGVHDADDAIILGATAECRCRLNDIPQAYADVARAIELAQKVGNTSVLANCHLWEGRALEAMGEPQAAERAYRHAVAAAEPLENDEILATSLHALAAVTGKLGDAEHATLYEQRAIEVAAARQAFFARTRMELRDVIPAKLRA